jgi:hypothetical protein
MRWAERGPCGHLPPVTIANSSRARTQRDIDTWLTLTPFERRFFAVMKIRRLLNKAYAHGEFAICAYVIRRVMRAAGGANVRDDAGVPRADRHDVDGDRCAWQEVDFSLANTKSWHVVRGSHFALRRYVDVTHSVRAAGVRVEIQDRDGADAAVISLPDDAASRITVPDMFVFVKLADGGAAVPSGVVSDGALRGILFDLFEWHRGFSNRQDRALKRERGRMSMACRLETAERICRRKLFLIERNLALVSLTPISRGVSCSSPE